MAHFGRLANDDERPPVNLLGDGFGFFAALEIARFKIGALMLEEFAVFFVRPEGFFAGQQEIAGVAGAHFDDVADLAEIFRPAREE